MLALNSGGRSPLAGTATLQQNEKAKAYAVLISKTVYPYGASLVIFIYWPSDEDTSLGGYPQNQEEEIWIIQMGKFLLALMLRKLTMRLPSQILVEVRGRGYDSLRDLYFRTGLSVTAIERLANADAFRSLGFNRRDALWAAQGLGASMGQKSAVEDLPLYAYAARSNSTTLQKEEEIALPSMTLGEHVVEDYDVMKLSLKAHPVSFARARLRARGFVSAGELQDHPADRMVSIAGLVLVRQRPGTASGVIFATLEDETGIANVIIWPTIFEASRKTAITARFLGVKGLLQREQSVIHVIARELMDLSGELVMLGETGADKYAAPADDKLKGDAKLGRIASTLPKGRNFH